MIEETFQRLSRTEKCNIMSCLFIRLGAAEAEDEQMAMRVCAGETMTIRSEFAVKHSSVTLTFNLDRKTKSNLFTRRWQDKRSFPVWFSNS